MVTVYLTRHGATAGNIAGRYIGCTDEPLCDAGIEQARALKTLMPSCDVVFTSPLARARQTARIVFPEKTLTVIEDLRECDFGDFVGKTADEMKDDPDYNAWINANCETPIPGGEDVSAFKERCVKAFLKAVENLPNSTAAAFITHGGAIMAILERLASCDHGFFELYPKNCEYVKCLWENGKLKIQGEDI